MPAESISKKRDFSAGERIWWLRIGAVLVTVVLLALSAPLIWTAVSAGIGLLALAAIVGVGIVGKLFLPLGLQRLENRLLHLRKAEAMRNPIEQLQNEVIRRADRLVIFRNALVKVGGQIESIQQMIEDGQEKFSGTVLARQERALERLQQFHSLNIARLNQAQEALQDFKNAVKLKESQFTISLAIEDATRALDPNMSETLVQDLLADTALRAVQDRFNNVFAELDVQLNSMDAPTRNFLDRSSAKRMEALTLPKQFIQRGEA
jgi:hypothetical protein